MSRITVVLAVVALLQLAAVAGAVTVDAEGGEPASATSAPPESPAPDADAVDPPADDDADPEGSLPGTGGRTSVLIGAALLVAAVVHWRLTAPPPEKD